MSVLKFETSNIVAVTSQLLDLLKVKVNFSRLKTTLEEHPNYPSLTSIIDYFKDLNVETQVYQIDKYEYDLNKLSVPHITHLSSGGGRFALIHGIDDGQVKISDERNKNHLISVNDYKEIWDGIIMYANSNIESGEKNYYRGKVESILQKIRYPFCLAVFLSTMCMIITSGEFSWPILFLVKLIGLLISVLLLFQGLNYHHPFFSKLCGIAEKNSCATILQSDAAYLTSWLNWSEVGLFYFSGSLLTIIVIPVFIPVLVWMNIVALPFTIYSITYQYRVGKWCVLCCSIQVLLVLEYVIFNFIPATSLLPFFVLNNQLFKFLLCFLMPISIWIILKPILSKSILYKKLRNQLNLFKYDNDLFINTLAKSEYYEISDNLMPILLGNPDAKTIITVISNPFCGACTKAHNFIDKWWPKREDVQIKLLFEHDDGYHNIHATVARHFMALSLLEDKKIIIKALNEWYQQNTKKYENWAERYPVEITDEIRSASKRQMDWCRTAAISFTPTVLINGHKLPEPYRIEDINYLI